MGLIASTFRWLNRFWFGPQQDTVYAICRIAFAIVSIANWIDLFPHRYHFFAPDGLVDQSVVKELTSKSGLYYFSFFYYIDDYSGVDLIFGCSLIAMLGLLIGFGSRLCAVGCWLWYLSYTNYAFMAMHSWDDLLRVYAFVMMISPLGKGIDQYWVPKVFSFVRYPTQVPRYGLALLQIQLALMYWHTLWLKLADSYWRNGELMSYFLMSMYARFPSVDFAHWMLISNALTYGTLALELMIPIWLWQKNRKRLGFLCGVGLHVGIAVTSDLALFSASALLLYLAFWDEDDINAIRKRLPFQQSRSTTT